MNDGNDATGHYKERGGRKIWPRGSGRGFKRGRMTDTNPGQSCSDRGAGRGCGRHPPGLTGREIGLWYRDRSKGTKLKKELENRQSVNMDSRTCGNIKAMISNIRNNDTTRISTTYPPTSVTNQDEGYACGGFIQQDSQHKVNNTHRSILDNRGEDESVYRSNEGLKCRDVESEGRQGDMESRQQESGQDTVRRKEDRKSAEEEALSRQQPMTREHLDEATEAVEVDDLWENDEEIIGLIDATMNKIEPSKFEVERGIKCDPTLDASLKHDLEMKQSSVKYQQMLTFRKKLPAYAMREEIVWTVARNQVVVISGETGCGKTTQVPQYILDDYIRRGEGSRCSIICTQPRRISAVSVAGRVAEERAEICGDGNSCGYLIRLENKFPRSNGSMLFCTTGCLLKFMENDPHLDRASHVILDEIHERDVLSDFLLIILKSILLIRPDLKVILMSATLNASMFSTYFNGCPMFNIPGYTFPVKKYLLEDVLEMTSFRIEPSRRVPRYQKFSQQDREYEKMEWLAALPRLGYSDTTRRSLELFDEKSLNFDLIVALLTYIVRNKDPGAILVFLPGWTDIRQLNDMLMQRSETFSRDRFLIIPLHSLMPTTNQRQVFDQPPPGVRKIIISTNIAETSITIDDVVFVIDCGQIKVKDFVPEINLCTLESRPVSLANAKQRSGRAGRVQPGESYHLYTRLQESTFQDYLPAEMLRSNLEELCLQIKLLKLGRIEEFISQAIEPPSPSAIKSAIYTLRSIKAMDSEERLTALGYHLARMPLDPHTGKMIMFGAMFCCLDPILSVAASLSFKDAFLIPLGKEQESDRARRRLAGNSKSDHIMLANAFQAWEETRSRGGSRSFCWDNFLSESTLFLLAKMRRQFAELLHKLGFISSANPKDRLANINSHNETLVKSIVCAGLYPNIAKLKGDPSRWNPKRPLIFQTKTDRRVTLHQKSVNVSERGFASGWFVYHKKLKTNSICIHDCSSVSTYPLLFFGGDFELVTDHGDDCVKIDDWIMFKASQDVANSVKDLRIELDKVFEEKIRNPGVTRWSGTEGAVLSSIIDLITSER